MRIPPIAVLFLGTVAVVATQVCGFAAAPNGLDPLNNGQAAAVDSTPGYYPTQQPSQYGGAVMDPGYSRTGFPSGGIGGAQYRSDIPQDSIPIISPFLLRNNVTANGNATWGRNEDRFLSPFVPQSAVFYDEDGSSTSVQANLGLYLQRDIDVQDAQIKAGPLYIRFTQIEAVGLYSDLSGPYAKNYPDDGFAAAIGLSFDIDLRISPRTFLTAQGTVYYLPLKNSFGFYASSTSATYLNLEHSFEIDRWNVTVYDYFDVYSPLSYLVTYGTRGSVGDSSGLYTIGSLPSHFEHPLDSDNVYFRNTAGVRASTYLSPDIRFSTLYEHLDLWNDHFDHQVGIEHINGALTWEARGNWFVPWLMYDGYLYDDFGTGYHQIFLGASMPFNRTVQAYGRVGWAWNSGEVGSGFKDGTIVWDVGISHTIDANWRESIQVGNSYRLSPILEESHGQYATYDLSFHSLYSTFFAGGTATWAHLEPSNDYSSLYTLYAGENITDNTVLRGTMIYAPSDFGIGTRTVWLYRAEIDHSFSPTLSLKLMYQLTDYHTNADTNGSYVDNLIMLTLTKRL